MAKNEKGYCVCELQNGGSFEVTRIDESRLKGEGFSFDIWFYPTAEKASYCLFSNKKGVKVGFEGGRFYFSPNKNESEKVTFVNNTLSFTVPLCKWSHLFITYDGERVNAYLQGYLIESVAISSEVLFSSTSYSIGSGFEGFIRSVRIYNKAVLEKDFYLYIQQSGYEEESMPDLVSFIGGVCEESGAKWKDLCNSLHSVSLKGSCSVGRVMNTAQFSESSRSCFDKESLGSNAGGFESGEFSLYARFCIQPGGGAKQVLFSNCFSSADKEVAVVVSRKSGSEDRFLLEANVGESIYSGVQEIGEGEWTDVAVTYDSRKLRIFVNGEIDGDGMTISGFKKPERGSIELGGRKGGFSEASSDRFHGCLEEVAVFDKALPANDIYYYHEHPPFLYEQNLRALYCFRVAFYMVRELVCGSPLSLSAEGQDIFRLTDQVDDDVEIGECYYAVKEKPSYSKGTLRKAQRFIFTVAEYYRRKYGLVSDDESLNRYAQHFGKDLLSSFPSSSLESMKRILAHKDVTADDVCLSVINCEGSGKIPGLLASFRFNTAWNLRQKEPLSYSAVSDSVCRLFPLRLKASENPGQAPDIFLQIAAMEEKKTSKNHKKAYSACEIFNSAEEEAGYLEVKGVKKSVFSGRSFSLDMWFYPAVGSNVFQLVCQKNGFVFGVDGGDFYFESAQTGRRIYSHKSLAVRENAWNHVFLTYDDETLECYLQGCKVGAQKIPKMELLQESPYRIGEDFCGFLRCFRIYRNAIPQSDFSRYLYQTVYEASAMPEVAAWVDCSASELRELVNPSILSAVPHGFCEMNNVAHSYVCEGDHCVNHTVFSEFESKRFTVYAKFFLNPRRGGRFRSILSTPLTPSDGKGCVSVYLKKKEGEDSFVLCAGWSYKANGADIAPVYSDNWKESKTVDEGGYYHSRSLLLEGSRPVCVNEWMDVAVVYDGEKLSLFVDGELDTQGEIQGLESVYEKLRLLLGNDRTTLSREVCDSGQDSQAAYPQESWEMRCPLGGALSCVALFQNALTEKDLRDFHENEPFVFESDLYALFRFDTGIPLELVHGSDVRSYSSPDSVIGEYAYPLDELTLVTGTNNDAIETDSYQYRLPEVKCSSKDDSPDKAAIALSPFIKYYEKVYGLKVNETAQEDLTQCFAEEIIRISRVEERLIHSTEKIDSSVIFDILFGIHKRAYTILFHALDFYFSSGSVQEKALLSGTLLTNALALCPLITTSFGERVNKEISREVAQRIRDLKRTWFTDGGDNKQVYYAWENRDKTLLTRDVDSNNIGMEINGIDLDRFEGNEFSFDIWFYPREGSLSYNLLSQTDGFVFGVDCGHLFLSAGGADLIRCDNSDFPVENEKWNHVFLTYDRQTVNFYLEGYLLYSQALSERQVLLSSSYLAGEGLDGFIRSVRIYRCAVEESRFPVYAYQTVYDSSRMGEVLAWIDCTRSDVRDLVNGVGGSGVFELSSDDYESVNLVSAYSPGGVDCYAFVKEDRVNPGGGDGCFSLYAKIYPKYAAGAHGEQAICSNKNNAADKKEVTVYLVYDEEKTGMSVRVRLGEQELMGESFLYLNMWYDLLVTYDGRTLTLFVNGENEGSLFFEGFQRADETGHFLLGNSYAAEDGDVLDCPFYGYLSKAAVFNEALTESDAKAFHETDPFLYDACLEALYCFDGGVSLEQVWDEEILFMKNGAEVKRGTTLAAQTNETDMEAEDPFYRVNARNPNYDADTLHNASLVLTPLIEYYRQMYGLEIPSETQRIWLTFFGGKLAGEESFQKLIQECKSKKEVEEETILEAVSVLNSEKYDALKRMFQTEVLSETVSSAVPTDLLLGNMKFTQRLSTFKDSSCIQKVVSNVKRSLFLQNNRINNNKVYYACKIQNKDQQSDDYIRMELNGENSVSSDVSLYLSIWFFPEEANEYTILSTEENNESTRPIAIKARGNGGLYLDRAGDITDLSSEAQEDSMVKLGMWNNLLIINGKKDLHVYLQGKHVKTLSNGVSSYFFYGKSYCFGKGFNGFVRSIIAKQISQSGEGTDENILKYIYLDWTPSESFCNAKAEGSRLQDEGSPFTEIVNRFSFHGSASSKDLIWGYNPKKGGGAVLKFAWSGLFLFSYYIKFFLPSDVKGYQSLVDARFTTSSEGVGLSAIKTDNGKIIPQLEIKGRESQLFKGNMEFIPNSWNDVIVSYSGDSKLFSLFINGQEETGIKNQTYDFSQSSNLDLTLGNNTGNTDDTASFEGWMTSIVVFDREITEEESVLFHKNEPYLYEDHLKAWLSVEGGKLRDFASCKEVENVEEGIRLISETNPQNVVGGYQYRIDKNARQCSDEVRDKGLTALIPILGVYGYYCGLSSSMEALDDTVTYFGEELISNEWLGSFLTDKRIIEADEQAMGVAGEAVGELLSQFMNNSTKVLKLLRLLNMTSTFNASIIDGEDQKWLELSDGGGAVPFCQTKYEPLCLYPKEPIFADKLNKGLLEQLASRLKFRYRMGDDEKKFQFSSLTLQHTPTDFAVSAVHLQDCDGVIVPPEWENQDNMEAGEEKKETKAAVYVGDQLSMSNPIQMKVEVEIISTIPGDHGEHKVEVKGVAVSLKNKETGEVVELQSKNEKGEAVQSDNSKALCNSLCGEGVVVVNGGPTKITVTAQVMNIPDYDIYKYEREYEWTFKVERLGTFIKKTPLLMYVIPVRPALPISLITGDVDNYPIVEVVDIGSTDGREIKNDKVKLSWVPNFLLNRATDKLYNCRYFSYNADSVMSSSDYFFRSDEAKGVLCFDKKKFFERYKGRGNGRWGLDCSCYAGMLCCLFWFLIPLVGGVSRGKTFMRGFKKRDDGNMTTVLVWPAGSGLPQPVQQPVQQGFSNHFIACAGKGPDELNSNLYYDASHSREQRKATFISLEWVNNYKTGYLNKFLGSDDDEILNIVGTNNRSDGGFIAFSQRGAKEFFIPCDEYEPPTHTENL